MASGRNRDHSAYKKAVAAEEFQVWNLAVRPNRTATLTRGEVVERLLYKVPATRKTCRGLEDNPFYSRQSRFVLHECGFLDPEDIREFMLHGGYQAARKAYVEMSPEDICKKKSPKKRAY